MHAKDIKRQDVIYGKLINFCAISLLYTPWKHQIPMAKNRLIAQFYVLPYFFALLQEHLWFVKLCNLPIKDQFNLKETSKLICSTNRLIS